MAGTELHRRIIECTPTDGSDQAHIDIHHVSRASAIPDRTEFLIGTGTMNPAYEAAQSVLALEASARAAGSSLVIGIPCNTFHAPSIFDVFHAELERLGSSSEILSMTACIADYLEEHASHYKRIGILSTTGTKKARIYHDLLKDRGYTLIETDEHGQDMLHTALYDPSYGLKAVAPASGTARGMIQDQARTLIAQGADCILLGCTELPLAFDGETFEQVPLIDPMVLLAQALVARIGA